jgi:hypothetical protein
MFLAIPICYTAAYTNANLTAAQAMAPANALGSWATIGLKAGFFQIVHGADLSLDGKTLEQFQPYTNALISFKLMSQMSQDDMLSYGPSLGLGTVLDNPLSMRFNSAASAVGAGAYGAQASNVNGPIGGNGISNNAPFPTNGGADFGDQPGFGNQSTSTYNNGLYSRISRIPDMSALGGRPTTAGLISGLYVSPLYVGATSLPVIMTPTQCATEFRASFNTDGIYMQWNDIAVIRLCDIFDSMGSLPLMKKFNGMLRLYLNTGASGAQCLTTASTSATVFSASTTTFVNTCPLLMNSLALTAPSAASGLVAGLSIARPQQTSIFGVNLAAAALTLPVNPMTSCRLYFPQIGLKAMQMDRYISENRSKKVVWRANLFNQFSNISAGSSFSGLVQSGVSNIVGVLILPFLSGSTNGLLSGVGGPQVTNITPFSQLISPFDTAPATSAPISLINLQVMVGGQNVLANVLQYTFENFLEQVSLFDKINRSDFGLSCGLISQQRWEQSRQYFVDCSRGQNADMMTPRNINVSFTNNCAQTIDIFVYTLYHDSCVVDVETGAISGR